MATDELDKPDSSTALGHAKSLGRAFSKVDLDGHNLPPSPAPSSPRNGKRYALATELVYSEGGDQYNASSVPIYQVCRWKVTFFKVRSSLSNAVD